MRSSILLSCLPLALLSVPAAAAIHPSITPRDGRGEPVATAAQADPMATCSGCHDAAWINGHNAHWSDSRQVGCRECHLPDGGQSWAEVQLDSEGRIPADKLAISPPDNGRCGRCHGLVHEGKAPLELPLEFDRVEEPDRFSLSRLTGAIVSSQKRSDSFLNVAGKQQAAYPWDLHAAAGVSCRDCHFSPNNPKRADKALDKSLPHLQRDPRRLTTGEYLERPDHRLEQADCRRCHDPEAVHDHLPYRRRHLEKVACQSCHLPTVTGPAADTIDSTMVDSQGSPLVSYRGLGGGEDLPPNVRHMTGYDPFLFPTAGDGGALAPFNLVTRWFWVDSQGKAVPARTVRQAVQDVEGWRAETIARFDSNGDGRLSPGELRIDSQEKRDFVAARLVQLGVTGAAIGGEVSAHAVAHGLVAGRHGEQECAACHRRNSRLDSTAPLAAWVPFGAPAELAIVGEAAVAGQIVRAGEGLALLRFDLGERLYVMGLSRKGGIDLAGFLIFLATTAGVALHAALRVVASRRRRGEQSESHLASHPTYMYGLYERIWHWTMAACVLALLWTGMEIHWPAALPLLGFRAAVTVHNVAAVALIGNAFLALFYHLATAEIRQFIPPGKDLPGRLVATALYYLRGIFAGRPHPFRKSRERKLNPLQQVTYVGLLNVLFPAQILTGMALWLAGLRPDLAERLGGLSWVAPVHSLVAWLFLTFLVVHLYLTTTGHTPTAHIRAMVTGYERLELDHSTVAPADGGNR